MKLLWLSADEAKVRLRSEQLLATARVGLAASGFAAVYLDPTEPAQYASEVYGLLAGYLFFGVALWVWLRNESGLAVAIPRTLYIIDLSFAGLLTLLTAGSNSPFFVFFLYVVMAAAMRYGFNGAFQAGAIAVTVMLTQPLVLSLISANSFLELNRLIVRVAYVLVMVSMLGYLVHKERDLRAEITAVARTLGRARDETSFTRGLAGALDEITRLFETTRAVVVAVAPDGARHLWTWESGAAELKRESPEQTVDSETDLYFFTLPADAHTWQVSKADARPTTVLDADGERTKSVVRVPPSFWKTLGCRDVVGVSTTLPDHWHVRLYVLDPPPDVFTPFMTHLLHVVAVQLAPALQNLYLMHVQAGANERARLARELHDRVVQSLIGLELQLAVMERTDATREALLVRIKQVHALLRNEIANVRDLMHELRPFEVRGDELPMFLDDLISRFERDTGIRAAFRCEVDAVALSAPQCGDLARLVQEALVNVRKHSGAKHVVINLSVDSGSLVLTIEDDGRGFDFEGQFEDERLWSEHRGPRVIKERARAIGGSLSIESRPGEGARLALVIPHAA